MPVYGDPDDADTRVHLMTTEFGAIMPAWDARLEARLYRQAGCLWREVSALGYRRSGAVFQTLTNGDRAIFNAYHFAAEGGAPYALGVHDDAGRLIMVGEVLGELTSGAVQIPSYGARLCLGEDRQAQAENYVLDAGLLPRISSEHESVMLIASGIKLWNDGVRIR